VQAVVDYFGPADLLRMMGHTGPGSPESNLIGGALKDNPGKANQASPVTYITKDAPPFLIVHGDADKAVPFNQSELLTAALQKAGVPVTFYAVKGAGHGLGILRDPHVSELTREFLTKYMKPAGP
jgi:dipeptidyl aminopeptidase/acylaminoacyl peptidase